MTCEFMHLHRPKGKQKAEEVSVLDIVTNKLRINRTPDSCGKLHH